MSLGSLHKCPKCGRRHRALTDMCYRCKRLDTEYDLAFELPQQEEQFEDTMARIQHEEKILKRNGYDPVICPAIVADRILKVRF